MGKPLRKEDDGSDLSGETSRIVASDNKATGIANANWARYEYGRDRGHTIYCRRARRLEDLYVGGGLQWRQEDRDQMEADDRYPIEINEVGIAVDTALGYQIHNRVSFKLSPKRETSAKKAANMTKLVMKKCDDMSYAWHESLVYADGQIQQRGYFDLRLYYDENFNGEPGLFVPDPMDVIPDPDAKSYDPDDWGDVILTRWLRLDEIEADYGPAKARQVQAQFMDGEFDFGEDIDDEERNTFAVGQDPATTSTPFDSVENEALIPRFRVVDRQYWKMVPCQIAVFPTGDIRVMENPTREQLRACYAKGALLVRKPMKRVRWTVSTENVLLHDDWSPYEHFTIIPFFPKFRRGITRGKVDDMEGPQELLNSSITTTNEVVRNTANSGYTVEENSLTNMSTEDLESEGNKNGLVIEFRKGSERPEKIKPNDVPAGLADLVQFASGKIKQVSGQTDQARAEGGKDQSGMSVEAQQFGAQIPMAPALENLAHTRKLFCMRLVKMLQQSLTEPQVMTVTETDGFGNPKDVNVYLHQPDPNDQDGDIFDPTSGEYDFAVDTQSTAVTFQHSQFNQALEMKKNGVSIPDSVLVENSSLNNKPKILESMASQQSDPLRDADVKLKEANAKLAEAKAIGARVEALFSGGRTAEMIAANPDLAPAADSVVKSAGYVDSDPPPIYPANVPAAAPPPANTNPLTPDNPDRGMTAGIEAGPKGAVP